MMSAVTAIRDRTVHQTTENDVRRTRLGLSGGRPPRMKPPQPAEFYATRGEIAKRHLPVVTCDMKQRAPRTRRGPRAHARLVLALAAWGMGK